VVAIEIVEDLVACEDLTPALAERYDGIAAEVRAWLERLLQSEAACRPGAGNPSRGERR
jgi:hypothetical protein